jgi:hypothetical protein
MRIFADHVTMTQSLHAMFCVDINISEFPVTRLRVQAVFLLHENDNAGLR